MLRYQPRDPHYADRVRENFTRQRFMHTLGAALTTIAPGEVAIELSFDGALTQQVGSLHAGVSTALMDSACGYAAYTLMDTRGDVVSVEFKVNLLAPALGTRFRATGRVVRAGRTLTVCAGEFVILASDDPSKVGTTVAIMTATMMAVRDRSA